MVSLKIVGSIVTCTNSHPFDEESGDLIRWENEGGRPLDSSCDSNS